MIPQAPIPAKTALGLEEQRRRSAGIGQRHRTILFLVDGRRSVGEVMRLAEQAGASAKHFEDLVRLGHLAVPVPQLPLASAEPEAQVQDVALDVEPESQAEPEREPDPVAAVEAAVAETPPPRPEPPLLDQVALPRVSGAPLVPVQRPAAAPRPQAAAPRSADDDMAVAAAREHLLAALRHDAPPFGSRLAARVRDARDAAALTDLVLELERHTARRQRSHDGLRELEAAREVLGLGNTLVADDSLSSWFDTA